MLENRDEEQLSTNPRLLLDNPQTALVDANHVAGTVAGRYAAIIASVKAESKGSSLVCVKSLYLK